MNVILFYRQVECTADNLLRLWPIADKNKIDAEVVVGDYRIENVIGLIEEFDQFLKTSHPVVGPPEKPIGAGHVRVELAQHEWGGIIADDLYSLVEVFERLFAISLMMMAQGDLAISFGH